MTARTQHRRMPTVVVWAGLGLGVLSIGAVVPLTGTSANIFFWSTVAISALYAMSVNLLLGLGGIPTFGQAAYFGLGAYTVGMLASTGLPLPLIALAGIAVAAVAGLAVAAFSLRTSGLAFSMLTLAFAQALYTLFYQVDIFGGENGIVGLLPEPFLGIDLSSGPVPLWLFTLVIVTLGIALLRLITVSPFGRTLQMIRDDEVRAAFLGIPVRRYQIAAFTLAAAVAGLSGVLFAYVQGLVNPNYLYWTKSGEPIIMAIIGGMHHFLGPVVGAVVYLWTVDALAKLTPAWVLWVGIAFLAVVLAAPGGLLGLPDEVRRLWRRGRQHRVSEMGDPPSEAPRHG